MIDVKEERKRRKEFWRLQMIKRAQEAKKRKAMLEKLSRKGNE